MMRLSIFTWSTVYNINEDIYNSFIHEDDTNSQKENVPPPLPLPHPKIDPIIVPGIIRYANNSHFIILFVDSDWL